MRESTRRTRADGEGGDRRLPRALHWGGGGRGEGEGEKGEGEEEDAEEEEGGMGTALLAVVLVVMSGR